MSKKRVKRKLNPKTKKEPRKQHDIKTEKRAKFAAKNDPELANKKRPIWKLDYFDFDGDWGIKKMDSKKALLDLHDKLKNYSNSTWGQIISDHKNNASVPVAKFTSKAKRRLRKIELDDNDHLFHFIFSSKKRLWVLSQCLIVSVFQSFPQPSKWLRDFL